MKILLINPNQYKHPPVIPIGLEYLAGSISASKHSFEVLDLCFSDNPEEEITKAINMYQPDITGISIRQIDSVLYYNNEFFLPEIRKFVMICKSHNCTTVLGGSGFSIMPAGIMDYTGADYGIYGPGEVSIVRLMDMIENGDQPERIISGYEDFASEYYDFKREKLFDYSPYIKNDGIVGFRTQIGCTGSCIFCTEANKQVICHNPEQVGYEISVLKKLGYIHFHLCDSEFNQNIDFCIEVCKAIKTYAGIINWALYMKPEPFSEDLFYWLEQSGAKMLTLSINTQFTDSDYLNVIGDFIGLASKFKIKTAIDLSTGFPYEDIGDAQKIIEFLNDKPVETVGVNSYYRVYPGTSLYYSIKKDNELKRFLIYPYGNEDLINPVFFNYLDLAALQRLTAGEKKYRIEGFEKASNYQRVLKEKI